MNTPHRSLFTFLLAFLIASTAFFSSFSASAAGREWTILVYMDGDNNLESAAINDFLEMASVGSSYNVRIVVMMDRINGFDDRYGNWINARRGVVNKGDVPDGSWGESMTEPDMGKGSTLQEFIEWGTQNFASSRYAVVLWNHGGGWRSAEEVTPSKPVKAICWDDTNNSVLYTKEVQQAIKAAHDSEANITHPHMSLIGFDACLMGMVEVAYQMRQSNTFADVMVGSEDNEPNDGWPYDTILQDLVDNPTQSAADLGKTIVKRYSGAVATGTMAAVDLVKINPLVTAIDDFGTKMSAYWSDDTKRGVIRNSAGSVKNALTAAIIDFQSSYVTNDNNAYAYGLTINFPSTGADQDYTAANSDFVRDTSWADFLNDFASMNGSWIDDARSNTGHIDDFYDIYDFADNVVGKYDITLDPTSLTVSENGGTGNIDVVLNAKPDNDVVIKASIINNKPVSSEDNAEIVGADGDGSLTLTFTTANWDTAQTITVRGLDDIYAGDDTCQVNFAVQSGSDANYVGLPAKTADVTVTSDELAKILVNPASLTVSENAGTATFDVTLAGLPRGDVIVNYRSLNLDEATVSAPGTFTFTPTNYSMAQTVTVTGVPDDFVGDDVADIESYVKTASDDPAYLDSSSAHVTVTCTDTSGQTADYTTSPLSLAIPEKNGTDTFTVVLNGRPHDPVKINMVSSDTTIATVSPATFTFTKDNWDTPQTATVKAKDNDLVGTSTCDIDLSVDPSSDSHFVATGKTDTVVVNLTDDDVPEFTMTPKTISMSENADSKTFSIVLKKGPATGNVVLDVDAMPVVGAVTGAVTVNKSSVTFDSTNWNTPQTVTITSVPDDTLGNKAGQVKVSVNAGSTSGQWVPTPDPQYVNITLINDDVAGFVISTRKLSVKEGASTQYDISLTAEPDSNVIINASSSDTAEVDLTVGNVATTPITFTPANWNVKQAVRVNGVLDLYATTDYANVVNTVDGTSDPNFTSLKAQTVAVTVLNDDTTQSAQLRINGALSDGTLTINEITAPGNSGTFTVALDAKPHSNVVVETKSLQPLEATINKTLLTFTPSTWNVPQTVTATSVANNYLGDGTANIRVRRVSGDSTFSKAATRKCVVTVTDNDPADAGGLGVSESALVLMQNRGRGRFSVSLTARPRTNVRMNFTVGDPTVARLSRAYAIFTKSSWNSPQAITVTGDPNRGSIADATTTVTIAADASSDAAWVADAAPSGGTVDVTVTSDVNGGFSLTPTSLDVDEMGATNTFDVVLNQEPTANVTISVTATPGITVSPTTLTFNPTGVGANPWYTPQTVTVTSDATNIPDDASAVITCAPGGDPNFAGLPPKTVAVTIKNLNPVANDDVAYAVVNKADLVAAGNPDEPVLLRVLNNDTEPSSTAITIKAGSIAGLIGGTATISDDFKTVLYTPPAAAPGDYTFTYIATNSKGGGNDDSYPATVTVHVSTGQPVAYGSLVQLQNTDIPIANFTRRPHLYGLYYDPIRCPAPVSGGRPATDRVRKATLSGLSRPSTKTPLASVYNEWRRVIRSYDRRAFSTAYRAGKGFDDYTGQVSSLIIDPMKVKTNEGGTKYDQNLTWILLLLPPRITAVKRFTTPYDDLDAPTAAWAGDLHPGSIMHVIGRFFGSRRPTVWLEYLDSRGKTRQLKCRVLPYTPYYSGRGVVNNDARQANRSYMNVDPTGLVDTTDTYGDSQLKVQLPTRFPRDWDYSKTYTLVMDNGVGMASFSKGLLTVSSSSENGEPNPQDDTFAAIVKNTKNNELDILDNDEFPNDDDVNVTFVGKPDHGGRVRWDRNKAKLIYTPAKDYTGPEIFTYRVTEKYTEQKNTATATVTVTVNP